MTDLYRHSIDVMLSNQTESGAFLASPTFRPYRYCWFRDGSYTAYALDLVGEHEAAHRFHAWASRVIGSHAGTVQRAEAYAQEGRAMDAHAVLHTRYTAEGTPGTEVWSNFQLDGFGTWLWALADHLERRGENLPQDWEQGARLAARYLAALWREPNYDLWEENGDKRHTYTQSAVYAGLAAAGRLFDNGDWTALAGHVREEVMDIAGRTGHFTRLLPGRGPGATHPVSVTLKGPIDAAVDGALLGVALPHGLVKVDDPLLAATVRKIEATLRHDAGGVHRYLWDTYFGGGEWILLTAWLGWYCAAKGETEKARDMLDWVEGQANESGDLPEQTPQHLIAPAMYRPWVAQFGEIATPLVWSHAMYVVLCHSLGVGG